MRPIGRARLVLLGAVSIVASVIIVLLSVDEKDLDMRLPPATSEDHQPAIMTFVTCVN